jgi:hypothetical protein
MDRLSKKFEPGIKPAPCGFAVVDTPTLRPNGAYLSQKIIPMVQRHRPKNEVDRPILHMHKRG